MERLGRDSVLMELVGLSKGADQSTLGEWPRAQTERTLELVMGINLKRQLPLTNPRKVLAIKPFQITHQIHKGYASFFVMSFSSRHLQIFTRFNCRFKVDSH